MEISKIVCINHPLASARLEAMNERFRQQRMKVELSPGVVPVSGEENFIGCLRAHKLAIARAKSDGLENILIFEDDVLFLKPWSWIQKQLLDVPDDYELVRLCIITDGVYLRKHVHNHVFRSWRAYGTQCYLVHSRCFDQILNFPETDAYDNQLANAGFVEYAVHPLPTYHEVGSSLIGNMSLQAREDFDSAVLTRSAALQIIDDALNRHKYIQATQLRIVHALERVKVKAHTQELRFLKSLIEKMEMSREEALQCSRALFVLSLQESDFPPS